MTENQDPTSWLENPYVGPRPFTRGEKTRFFGRDREAHELLSLVTANRQVLFYARSGAGKSSLVNTLLIPGLEEKGFEVLPVGRVSGAAGYTATQAGDIRDGQRNPFVYNLMLSVDQSGSDLHDFPNLELADFLINLVFDGTCYLYQPAGIEAPVEEAPAEEQAVIWPRALIVDQFEEILTTNLQSWQQRADFFRQLAEAMEADPYLWVLLSMREDHVASLDPYAYLVPGRLRTRYYMERMGADAAREAIEKPAALNGRPFSAGVAGELVDNLRQVRGPDQAQSHLGQFVEPVQLQVVCYQLWENLRERDKTHLEVPGWKPPAITSADLKDLGNVDTTLGQFYERAIQNVLEATEVSESSLRSWFETELITEAGTRNLLYQGSRRTGSLPNEAARLLANQYLIRGESRAGGIWYELIHDRFVAPILQANAAWRSRQAPLFQAAEAWQRSGRKRELLYAGELLQEALATADQADLEPVVRDFLTASEEAQSQQQLAEARQKALEEQQRAEEEARSARRLRLLAIGLFVALALVVGASLVAINQANRAEESANLAAREAEQARLNAEEAVANAEAAREAEAAAQLNEQQALTAEAESAANAAAAREAEALAREAEATSQANADLAATRAAQARQNAEAAIATQDTQQDIIQTQEGLLAPPTPSATPTPVPTATPTAAPDATPTSAPLVRRSVIARSNEGQLIEVVRIGRGNRNLVLVGGIHAGFSPGTVDLAEGLIDYFEANPVAIPEDVTLHVVPVLNPDSEAAPGRLDGRLNANEVDLNRNWNCNWAADATWAGLVIPGSGGLEPYSEPEVKGMLDYLEEIKPAAVVVWGARSPSGLVSPGGCGPRSVVSREWARAFGQGSGYQIGNYEALTGQQVNGDMTNDLDRLEIPAISVLLPTYEEPDWSANLAGVLALLEFLSPPTFQFIQPATVPIGP